jgi:hypothetical protein
VFKRLYSTLAKVEDFINKFCCCLSCAPRFAISISSNTAATHLRCRHGCLAAAKSLLASLFGTFPSSPLLPPPPSLTAAATSRSRSSRRPRCRRRVPRVPGRVPARRRRAGSHRRSSLVHHGQAGIYDMAILFVLPMELAAADEKRRRAARKGDGDGWRWGGGRSIPRRPSPPPCATSRSRGVMVAHRRWRLRGRRRRPGACARQTWPRRRDLAGSPEGLQNAPQFGSRLRDPFFTFFRNAPMYFQIDP